MHSTQPIKIHYFFTSKANLASTSGTLSKERKSTVPNTISDAKTNDEILTVE